MWTLRHLIGLSFFVPAMTWQCWLGAAETPLPAIPAGVELVVRVSCLRVTADKVVNVMNELRPKSEITDEDEMSPLWLVDWVLNASGVEDEDSVVNRPDVDQDWWFYCWNAFGPDASIVMLIPTSNPDGLQASEVRRREKNRETSSDSIVYKQWVVKGASPAIEAVRQCLAGTKPSVLTRFDNASLEIFGQGDLGVFVDTHAIVTAAAELKKDPSETVLELASIPFELAFELFSDFVGGIDLQTGNENAIMSGYLRAAVAVAQVLGDSEQFVASVNIDEESIQVEHYLTVKPESSTALFFGANPGGEMKALSGLPASSAIYLGLHGDWNSKFFSAKSLQEIADAESDSPASTADEKQSLVERERQLNYGTISIAYPMHPFDQGLLRSVTIKEVNFPELARDLAADQLNESTILLASNTTGLPQPVRTTEKYGSLEADVVTLPTSLPDDGPADVTLNLSSLLYGADRLSTRTVYLKDRIVQSVGGSKVRAAAAFRRVLESADQSPTPDHEFAKLRDKLHDEPNMLLMVDTGVLMVSAMQAWNSLVTVMMQDEELEEAEIVLAPMKIERAVEGAIPDEEAKLANLDAKPQIVTVDQENLANDAFDVPLAALQVMKVADFETQVPKFDAKDIERIGSAHAMIGCSLKLEPKSSRLRFVVPRQSLRTLVEAGELLFTKMLDAESVELEAIPVKKQMLDD